MERSPSGRPCPAGAPMKICEAKFHGEVRSDVGMKKAPVLRPGLLHGPKSATNWSWWTDSNPRPADYKSAALPAVLHQHIQQEILYQKNFPHARQILPPGLFSCRFRGPAAMFFHLSLPLILPRPAPSAARRSPPASAVRGGRWGSGPPPGAQRPPLPWAGPCHC